MNLRYLVTIVFCAFTLFINAQNVKIDSLHGVLKTTKSTEVKAKTLLKLIDYHFATNKDSAEIYLKETIAFTENKDNLFKENVLAILKYAQFFIIKGDYPTSQKQYDLAWSKLKDNYDYELYNKYYGDFGVLNFYQGNFKGAKENFEKALALAEKEKNEVDQLRYLNNSALAMSYLGEGEASIDVHRKAIDLAEKLNDSTSLGKSFNNIGLIYEDMKEYNKALEFYLQALEIKKNGKSEVDVANSFYNVANVYTELSKKEKDTLLYAKAENYFLRAKTLSAKINYGKVLLFSDAGIAQLATVRNQPKKAIKIYKDVVEKAKTSKDNEILRISYLNLGINYLKLNDIKNAENNLLLAKPMIEAAKKPGNIAKLYKGLSDLYNEKKQFSKAYEYLKKQTEIEDELTENTLKEKISDFEVKYETEKKEREIAVQKEQLLENELALKNRTLYGIIITAILIILGIIFFAIYKRNQLKRQQLQKEIDLKDALATIRTQNRLQEQRLKISRDLHDNIGSQLTFIISSLDNLKFLTKDANDKLKDKLASISSFTGETIHQLRDTIWAMNKSEISSEDIHARILSFVEKAKIAVPATKFSISENLENNINFTSVVGMNIFRATQEAINNAIKYAEASEIKINLFQEKDKFKVHVIDNGIGFDIKNVELGNGLSNMEKRMSEVDGTVKIKSTLTKGTEIYFELPI